MKDEEDNIQNGESLTEGQSLENAKEKTLTTSPIAHPILDKPKAIGVLDNPHDLGPTKSYSQIKREMAQGSRLKSSSPPLTPEQIQPEIEKQKEAIEYFDKFKDLPINWPYCSRAKCIEPAHWAIQEDMDDPKSPLGFLCSSDFTSLPQRGDGKFYRVFKLSVRNYLGLLQKSIDNKSKAFVDIGGDNVSS